MTHARGGQLEVICGSMFSGKTEELIRRIKRAQIARQRVQVFKPEIDTRYSVDHVASHSAQKMRGELVRTAAEILDRVRPDTHVVAIDEGQFFDASLVRACQELADRGLRVMVAGLDQDYRGEPFEPMPQLMAIAEMVTKCNAICVICGGTASRTQRTTDGSARVQVGASDSYEARCRECHNPTLAQEKEATLQARFAHEHHSSPMA